MFNFKKRNLGKTTRINRSTVGRRNTSSATYDLLEERKMLAAFSGTDASDNIVINFDDGRPVSIEINGVLESNPDATLELDISEGIDGVEFTGIQEFKFESMETSKVALNDRVFMDLGSRGDANTFITGDGDDIVSVKGKSLGFTTILTGAGNDSVEFLGASLYGTFLGEGDDQLIFREGDNSILISAGDEGYDSFEGLESLEYLFLNNYRTPEISIIEEFERFVANQVEEDVVNTFQYRTDLLIIDSITWVLEAENEELPARLENFNFFEFNEQSFAPIPTNAIFVTRTDYPLNIQGGYVNIGGDFSAGRTSQILHDVTLEDTEVLVFSNSAANRSQQVIVSQAAFVEGFYQISGLSKGDVFVKNVAHINLAGSNTLGDSFLISQIDSHLILFGNGGDDQFFVGHDLEPSNLTLAGQVVNIVAGEGNDYVQIDDRDSSVQRQYGITPLWVYSNNEREGEGFGGVSHLGAERLHLIANSVSDRFFVAPSQETQFTITGGKLDEPFGHLYHLVPPNFGTFQFLDLEDNEYVWHFGEASEFIHLRNKAATPRY